MTLTLSIPRAGGRAIFEPMLARLHRGSTEVRDVMKAPAVTVPQMLRLRKRLA